MTASLLAGIFAFRWHAFIERMRSPVRLFDAAGLALFAVTGAHKSLAFGLHSAMAVLLGMLTGIGGGMARDVLLARVPVVLRSDRYFVAALAGAALRVVFRYDAVHRRNGDGCQAIPTGLLMHFEFGPDFEIDEHHASRYQGGRS